MNSEAMLLSIVIPAYNYAHLLPRAVESVVSQLQDGVELIIVDDGSDDETPQYLDTLLSVLRVRCFRQDNAGAAAARNGGALLAKGSYVLFLDADDQLLPGAVRIILEQLHANEDLDVLLGGYVTRRESGRSSLYIPSASEFSSPHERVKAYLLDKRLKVSHGAFVASRAHFLQRPYVERFKGQEDVPVFAFLMSRDNVMVVEEPLVLLHRHEGSLRGLQALDAAKEMDLVAEVFTGLSSDYAGLRGAYAARRNLSLMKRALRRGEKAVARRAFRDALQQDWKQVLQSGAWFRAIRLIGRRRDG